jgi:hypothetical protein
MRRSFQYSLLVFALAVALRSPAPAEGQVPAAKQPHVAGSLATWVEDGYGKTANDAEQVALGKARTEVVGYLREHYPALHWTPSPDFLSQHRMIRLEGSAEEKTIQGEVVQVAHARAEITSQSLREIREFARVELKQQRQVLTAKGLGAVVALLVVFAAYLRLEDLTRGYYTRLLRLTALALLVLVGASLLVVG